MREKTYHLYLNEEERSRVIQSLIALKNNLAASLLAQPLISVSVEQVICFVMSKIPDRYMNRKQ